MVGNGLRKRRAVFKVLKGTTKFFISQKAFHLPSSRMVVLRFVGRCSFLFQIFQRNYETPIFQVAPKEPNNFTGYKYNNFQSTVAILVFYFSKYSW